MNIFNRILTFLLVMSMPLSASAQFVPIQQAKDQVASAERTELNTVLTDISSKGDIARRNVQTILSDAAGKQIGASAAGRKIETVIGKLKTDLNGIINAFAKKNPPANQLRAAYNSAQDTLNSIRRQSGEVLDQVGFDKAADPKALSGKYLDYQKELQAITAKGLADADERLADRGTKESVSKDLQKIADSTQKKIDINTTTFLSTNTDVLPSAVERVKKGVVEAFGREMATRFATAKERGSDKSLDLSPEELAKVQEAKTEMQAIADRAIQTIQEVMQQISSSNIPTASNVPGQNPLLEAKIRATKQLQQIKASTAARIEKVNARFQADGDITALAKEIVNKESKKIVATTNDTFSELNKFFSAGDPSKKQYNKAKNAAQDEAEGCTDFFCTIGRVVSDVGSGVLAATTGVQIAPKTFTSIMGIKDPKGYVPSQYSGGNYAGSYTGNVPFNPSCYGALPTSESKAPRFSFVEKVQAQTSAEEGRDTAEGGAAKPAAAPLTGNAFQNALNNGSNTQTGTHLGNTGNTTAPDPYAKSSSSTTTQKSGLDWGSVFRNISPWLNNTIQTAAGGNSYFGNCYGQSSGYGGLPGYGSVYGGMGSTTLGSIAGQQLFGTSNLGFNSGFIDQNNAGQRLAAALTLLGQTDSVNAAKYQQAVRILQSGPVTFDKIPLLRDALAGTNLNSTFGAYGDSNPISGLIYSVCAQAVNGDPALVGICRQMLTPINTPGINPNPSGTLFTTPSGLGASTTQDPDLTQIATDLQTMGHINGFTSVSKCTTYQKNVTDVKSRTEQLNIKFLATTASTKRSQVLDGVNSILRAIDSFTNACLTAKAPSAGGLTPSKTDFELAVEKIDDLTKAFAFLGKCDPLDQPFAATMAAEIPGLSTAIATGSGSVGAAAVTKLSNLKAASDRFLKSCSTAAPAPVTADPAAGSLATAGISDGKVPVSITRSIIYSPYTYTVKMQNISKSARLQADPYEFPVSPGQAAQTIRLPAGKYWVTHEPPPGVTQLQANRYTITLASQTGCSIIVPANGAVPIAGDCGYDPNIAAQLP